MCKIPIEVWDRIIGMLVRPIPPGDIGWEDAHQQDLVQMMRVNKFSYEIAAKHLYEEVATKHLNELVAEVGSEDEGSTEAVEGSAVVDCGDGESGMGTPTMSLAKADTPGSNRSVRTSKRSLLRRVRAIHVIQTKAFYAEYLSVSVRDVCGLSGTDPGYGRKILRWLRKQQTSETSVNDPPEPYGALLPGLSTLSARVDVPERFKSNWIHALRTEYSTEAQDAEDNEYLADPMSVERAFFDEVQAFATERLAATNTLRLQGFCRTAYAGAVSVWRPGEGGAVQSDLESDATSESSSYTGSDLSSLRSSIRHFMTNAIHYSDHRFDPSAEWANALCIGAENLIEVRYEYLASDWGDVVSAFCRRLDRDHHGDDVDEYPFTTITFLIPRPDPLCDDSQNDRDQTDEESYLRRWKTFIDGLLPRRGLDHVKVRIKCRFADQEPPCQSCGQRFGDWVGRDYI